MEELLFSRFSAGMVIWHGRWQVYCQIGCCREGLVWWLWKKASALLAKASGSLISISSRSPRPSGGIWHRKSLQKKSTEKKIWFETCRVDVQHGIHQDSWQAHKCFEPLVIIEAVEAYQEVIDGLVRIFSWRLDQVK